MLEEAKKKIPLLPFEKEARSPKKGIFYRTHDDYLFAGICGGLAKAWGVDSTLIRLVFLILSILTGGLMLIAYLIMLRAIPLEPLE